MQKIIDFGMSDKVASETQDGELIYNGGLSVLLADQDSSYWKDFQRHVDGTFRHILSTMIIYIKNRTPDIMQKVLTHEIGHSLAIADSYAGGSQLNDIRYSSDIRPSIMNGAITLTCDDADALANAIYLVMKNQDPSLPDFSFSSFCKKENETGIVFKNAKQTNRKPTFQFINGKYYVTEFCRNGNIKKTLEINYKEPNALKTIAANECESVPYEIPQLPLKTENTPEAIYQQVDLSNPNRKKIPLTLNTIVQEYAPLVIREISFNSDLAQILVKIKDWRGQLLYVYAILDDTYAFGYSVPDDTSFIYNIQHHDQYTLWRDGAVFGDINPILIIQMDGLRDLIDKEKKNYYGIYKSDFQPDEYILQAFRWQEYIRKYYPVPDIKLNRIRINKKKETSFRQNLYRELQSYFSK